MTELEHIRKRTKPTEKRNGFVNHEEENKVDTEFICRESPLNVLIEGSQHLRVIYNIFIVILIILIVDTVIYDLVEHGKIKLGFGAIIYGFGDIKRGAKLWLYEMSLALIFYPGLRIFAAGRKLLKRLPAIQRIWSIFGVIGLVCLQMSLIGVPVLDLSRKHLALGSSVTVTTEMFRLVMKIHAVAMACVPRIQDENIPLPTFKNYLYFLFAPTLIYRDSYPRTKKTRWTVVAFNLLEVGAIIFYNGFLWERFILPYWSDYGKQTEIEAGTIVRGLFACVLPGLISFLCGFYCLLHAWLNAFAEMLRFGDRLFYEEWWISSQFSRYYRAWNRVVYSWLRDHIYRPLVPYSGRAFATFTVFLASAVAHEVILTLSFGFFYPVMLLEFGVFGLMFVPITAYAGRRFPKTLNVIMWFTFFLGNGVFWSLYPMEYFARKNCPPSEHDSFFIPKSWSCPKIILKPNWTFENPFSY